MVATERASGGPAIWSQASGLTDPDVTGSDLNAESKKRQPHTWWDFSRDPGHFQPFRAGTAIAVPPPVLPHEESRSACAGLSVLVVDDNHYLRDVVRVILEREGAAVLDAAGVAQAQTLLECVVPDAVVTDFDLFPEVRGGVLMLEHVKRRYSSCPVVLLTDRSDTYEELCAIGFDEVVFKPASTTALIGAILAAIRRCRSDSKRETTAA